MAKPIAMQARDVTLRDSRSVTLRPLEEGDRATMVAFGQSLPEDDRLYLELDFHNPNTIARLVNAAAAENWRQVVAVSDGAIVGYSNVRLLPGWKSHVGDSHLVISEGWRRSGLGTALAQTILEAARDLGVSKVIAEMIEEQGSGRAIFERLGFRNEGVLANHVRDQHGGRHNMVILGYELDRR
jgi:L-amino acid N-acyltransferase YncA